MIDHQDRRRLETVTANVLQQLSSSNWRPASETGSVRPNAAPKFESSPPAGFQVVCTGDPHRQRRWTLAVFSYFFGGVLSLRAAGLSAPPVAVAVHTHTPATYQNSLVPLARQARSLHPPPSLPSTLPSTLPGAVVIVSRRRDLPASAPSGPSSPSVSTV